ncbi:GHMP family kinase ATP-binding protein [Streptomyces chartreusis]|uniref:GHMP family kinase ATP-binding protein n=1 Tax=Streptomyces chartreusis TaxID=1969 RepID=UPI00364ADC67
MRVVESLVDQPRRGVGRVGLGTANGTFGELLQGALPGPGEAEGEGRFLVTLPVARWSTARFELRAPGSGLTVSPAGKTKALALARSLLAELGHPAEGSLVLHSSIPEGKGLASSSADLVATARAVLAVVGRPVSPRRLGELLTAIEPTDGVMHPGIVAFDHRRGVHLRTLGRLPALQVVAVDQGGHVDTVAFNRRSPGYGPGERRTYARLLGALGRAVADGDLAGVGAISTESADLNQVRMPNRNFAALREICRTVGGLGLVACHSGTMIGVLLSPHHDDYRAQLSLTVQLTEDLPGRTLLYRTLGT